MEVMSSVGFIGLVGYAQEGGWGGDGGEREVVTGDESPQLLNHKGLLMCWQFHVSRKSQE